MILSSKLMFTLTVQRIRMCRTQFAEQTLNSYDEPFIGRKKHIVTLNLSKLKLNLNVAWVDPILLDLDG